MVTPLLSTKLNPPSLRPAHVPRPRLLKQLNRELQTDGRFTRKLTLVSAPAGYGKTTLVAEWLDGQRFPVAWFSLDESDNDPLRFLTYLITACDQIHEGIGSASLAMLQSPQLPPPEALLTPLLNAIAGSSSSMICVLDDYHLIQAPPIHPYLNFLIEHLPPQMHVVITAREDPPLPLHRLRALGQMEEIRQEDIRFTVGETSVFLENVVPEKMSSEDIAAIERRTEGWVTGIQLLVLSLQKYPDAQEFIQTFTGSDRFVLDYLFEEVFHRQTGEVQEFLIKTSMLEQLTPGLCEAVTGRGDSEEVLRSLDQANLFILPLDQANQWYRYHRLFRDLLRHRLRLREDLSLEELHHKASLWYEDQGYLEDAVHHALEGSHWERAAALIIQASDELLKGGAVATLLGWFRRIPEKVIYSNPQHCLTYAWALLLASQIAAADPFLEAAEEMAVGNPQLLGEIAAAQAFQAQTRGDEPRMVELSERALSLLPETDLSSRGILTMNLGIAYWHVGDMTKAEKYMREALPAAQQTHNKYAEITSLFFLGRVYGVRGQLHKALEYLKEITQSGVRVPSMALAQLDLSAIHYELNHLDLAESHLEQSFGLIDTKSNFEFQIAGYMHKARIKLARGDKQGAMQVIEESRGMAAPNEIPQRTWARLAAYAVEVAIAMGDLDLASHWAEQVTTELDAHSFYRFLYLTPIRLLMAQDKMPQALAMLEEASIVARDAGWTYGLIALNVMQALAAPNRHAALEYLTEALALAQPEKFIRTFVDAGADLKPLLLEAARQGVFPAYMGEVLAAFDEGVRADEVSLPSGVEPLSERELEVLRLLAAGLTNRQIAEQIVVSVSTVKSHVHHICTKLGVSNRTQAVARARELDLV
jgi:LuxR family maltose regulon positive regulatory protein